MPLAVVDFVGNHSACVPMPKVITEIRKTIFYLDSGKISMIDPSHIEKQPVFSLCSDFKFNCESAHLEKEGNRKGGKKALLFYLFFFSRTASATNCKLLYM